MELKAQDTFIKIAFGMLLIFAIDEAVELARGGGSWSRIALPIGGTIYIACLILRDATENSRLKTRWVALRWVAAPFFLMWIAGLFGLIKS